MTMTHASRYRSSSPGSKRLVDPLRASTGTVAGDLYSSPTSYHGYDGYLSPKAAERRSGFFSVDGGERLEAHPISSTTYRDGNHSTKLKTSYAIRPRSHTTTDSSRRPLSVAIPSSSLSSSTSTIRKGPVITSAYSQSPSPLPPRASYSRDEPEQYVSPATSGRSHKRIMSSDYTSDSGYGGRAESRRTHEPSYRTYRPGGVSRYHAYGDPRQWDDSKYYDAYSYTNARETFEKESAAKSSQRTHRPAGRPTSMVATDSALIRPVYEKESKRLQQSHRTLDRRPDEERLRITSGRDYTESESHRDQHRHPYQQRLAVHQDREDGYQSFTDDHKHSSRHRHRSRPRESRKHAEDFLAPVLSGLATLGLASGFSGSGEGRDSEPASRSDRHRSRDIEHDDHDSDYYREREREKAVSGDERVRHRHRRHRDRSQRPGDSSESSGSEEHSRRRRRGKSSSRKQHDSGSSDSGRDRRSIQNSEKLLATRKEDAPQSSSKRSPDGDGEERPRKPVAVEPPTTKEPEAPPKSILKPPREKFPEDDNHVREGVAPLKDAQKNGIPTGARWTKIDRRLVNPAALEMGHERFEERAEYVIVLRVLTKEEIQAYAVKTQEIRDTRYKVAQEERRRLREERRRKGQLDSSSSDDEEDDEEERAPLAIEAAPAKDDFPVQRGKDHLSNDIVAEAAKIER